MDYRHPSHDGRLPRDRFLHSEIAFEREEVRHRDLRRVRGLILLYFVLLIVEGAVRKWILPQFSTPLLIVRDPVVILAYFLALRSGFFPWNSFVVTACLVGSLSLVAGLLVPDNTLMVALYGFRTDFLQLPFIFLMARVLREEDLRRIGSWVLIATIPVAILMLVQYLSPGYAFINTVPGGVGSQIGAFGERIRPPGPFSFITGVAEFFSLATAFILVSVIYRREYALPLVLMAMASLVLGSIVSISRLTIISEAIVVGAFFFTCLFHPGLSLKFVVIGAFAGLLFISLGKGGLTGDALDVFSKRVELADDFEKQTGSGTSSRISLMFTEPLSFMERMPWLGDGLGTGTNAGAILATGRSTTAEGEWARIVNESGPILGFAFIAWRALLLLYLGAEALRLCLRGHILPLLLFAAMAYLLLIGQWGRPTTLGFAIFTAGLCLTSISIASRASSSESPP